MHTQYNLGFPGFEKDGYGFISTLGLLTAIYAEGSAVWSHVIICQNADSSNESVSLRRRRRDIPRWSQLSFDLGPEISGNQGSQAGVEFTMK